VKTTGGFYENMGWLDIGEAGLGRPPRPGHVLGLRWLPCTSVSDNLQTVALRDHAMSLPLHDLALRITRVSHWGGTIHRHMRHP
jgi:hypothetical protein